MADFLKTQFSAEEDVLDVPEHWPRFAVNEHDEVVRVPARPADPQLDV